MADKTRAAMSDEELIDHTKLHMKQEATLDLEIIEDLRAIHSRKLYLAHGSRNFHVFCTEVLGMSSDSAWRRIHAASLADRFPDVVKPLIADRKVHLTGLALLDRVITPENGERLIQEAAGKSTTQIKAIIAREAPEQCKASVRKEPKKQLSETTWKFTAVMNGEVHALLEQVEDMANSSDPNVILHEALKAYRDVLRVKKQKALKGRASSEATARPQSNQRTTTTSEAAGDASTTTSATTKILAQAPATPFVFAASMRRQHDPRVPYIPRWMEREVRERDGHQCTFVGHGGRCTARRDLQVHHIIAVALGGLTELGNLTLHCGAHNRYQAELDFGPFIANAWRDAAPKPERAPSRVQRARRRAKAPARSA